MRICANCFNDEEIKQFIISSASAKIDSCDLCCEESISIDINELSDFFGGLLDLFVKDDNGQDLVELIQHHWHIFKSIHHAHSILSFFINRNNNSLSIYDKVSYIQEIKDFLPRWKDLKEEVRERQRFFCDCANYDIDKYIQINDKIRKDTILYRARVVPYGEELLEPQNMKCPPKEKATAGRANPIGIPYLYLCSDKETTCYEIRAVYLDRISIGQFKVLQDLDIVDFSISHNFSLFNAFSFANSLVDFVRTKILFDNISKDISRPLRRFDNTELEYVPTQLVCEYCKQIGADGVRFNSSLHNGGVNVVLFYPDKVDCIKVETYEVDNVTILTKLIK